MLQRPFPKLKKHGPTNLYMLYPMMQSVARVCVEIDKKKALQVRCRHHHEKKRKKIILPRSYQNRNETWKVTPRAEAKIYVTSIIILNLEFCHTFLHTSAWTTVSAANNTPACQPEALPARYRRTASLSTYTDTLKRYYNSW
jgi:hypothetical protein